MANLNLKWMVVCVTFLILLMIMGGCASQRDRTFLGVATVLGGGPRAECPAGTISVNNVCENKKDWQF